MCEGVGRKGLGRETFKYVAQKSGPRGQSGRRKKRRPKKRRGLDFLKYVQLMLLAKKKRTTFAAFPCFFVMHAYDSVFMSDIVIESLEEQS